MTDIPFENLIILLLVLASLIGRMFQKKKEQGDTPSPTPLQPREQQNPSEGEEVPRQVDLGEALRDFWKKAQESVQPQPATEPTFEEEEPQPPAARQKFVETKTSEDPFSSSDSDFDKTVRRKMEEAQRKVEAGRHDTGMAEVKKGEAITKSVIDDLRQENSLRKAFLLKEILDQPVSLRSGFGHEINA